MSDVACNAPTHAPHAWRWKTIAKATPPTIRPVINGISAIEPKTPNHHTPTVAKIEVVTRLIAIPPLASPVRVSIATPHDGHASRNAKNELAIPPRPHFGQRKASPRRIIIAPEFMALQYRSADARGQAETAPASMRGRTKVRRKNTNTSDNAVPTTPSAVNAVTGLVASMRLPTSGVVKPELS
jgi:hypothetical protein